MHLPGMHVRVYTAAACYQASLPCLEGLHCTNLSIFVKGSRFDYIASGWFLSLTLSLYRKIKSPFCVTLQVRHLHTDYIMYVLKYVCVCAHIYECVVFVVMHNVICR